VGQSVTMHVIREERRRQRRKLESWKEIAAFFARDERTVKRWEKEKGLPVHRIPEHTGARVFAYSDELTDWMSSPGSATAKSEEPEAESPPAPGDAPPMPSPARRRIRPLLVAAACVLLFCASLLIVHARNSSRLATNETAGNATSGQSGETDPVARELYLSGRYHWDKRTPEDLTQAVSYFNQAIARDPNYAAAYVGLANCYNLLREFTAMPPEEAFPPALAAARKATELDPNSAEAHTALAFVTFYWNWDALEAEHEFRRALELDPRYVTAHHWYATFLMVLGRHEEALQQIELAQQLDPASTPILADKGFILYRLGKKAEAVALLNQLAATQPAFFSTHQYLSFIYIQEGNDRGYIAEASKAAELSKDARAMATANAAQQGYNAGGRKQMLQNILQMQKKQFDDGRFPAFDVAATEARLGNVEDALHYLTVSLHQHEVPFLAIRIHEPFVPLHGNPAFQKLVAEAGLPSAPQSSPTSGGVAQ
jgi:tetratricopeptide (TPR) repeat protein